MAHIGRQPTATGALFTEFAHWNQSAWKYFHSTAKEAALLRVKVFNFFTWQKWNELLRFEQQNAGVDLSIGNSCQLQFVSPRQLPDERGILLQHFVDMEEDLKSSLSYAIQSMDNVDTAYEAHEDWAVVKATIVSPPPEVMSCCECCCLNRHCAVAGLLRSAGTDTCRGSARPRCRRGSATACETVPPKEREVDHS